MEVLGIRALLRKCLFDGFWCTVCFLWLGTLPSAAQEIQLSAVGQAVSDTAAELVRENYEIRIGPGDLISVEVYPDENFSREVRVAQDGSVTLPLVGTLRWKGMSVSQAEAMLEALLRDGYYRDPRVLIRIVEPYSSVVGILGAVVKPQMIPVYGATDVLKILGTAGGFVQQASGRLIVVRGGNASSAKDVHILDGRALLERGDMGQNIQVFAGDTIFAPSTERIYVFGQVETPGSYDYAQGITLLRAITLAGGFTDTAKEGSVEVLRRTGKNKSSERTVFDLDQIINKKIEDPQLQPDDVIVVPERFF